MKLRPVLRPAALAVLAVLSSLSLSASADDVRRSYIVQLNDLPVAKYTGGVAGLAATKPAAGARLNATSSEVQAYLGYLQQQQASVIASVPAARIMHQYKLVLNGFAARLTEAEVRALKKNPAVSAVNADEARTLDTNYTPTFLGLDKAGGLWEKLGGQTAAGENVVIGIVDTGVWPDNPSYADKVDADGNPTFAADGTLAYQPLARWNGACETGEGFTQAHCNNKLIGARFFREGFEQTGYQQHWSEFISPRDSVGGEGQGGHGTHTSSTAGGNHGVAADLDGVAIGRLSGMAPRARIAAYKVCWTYMSGGAPRNSCFTSDSVAAIDQAVADGVDVINYSIGGSTNSVTDPVELAFFGAADAGVFVAASAGNDGPANTVAHVSPWLTTVAASTHNRYSAASVTLASGAKYTGASYNDKALPATPTILAQDAAMQPYASLNSTDKAAAARCYTAADRAAYGGSANAALDPAKVQGKILLCERGSSARLDKSAAVKQAGGAGMILIDVAANTTPVADPHSVPAVHLNAADGALVKAYLSANANSGSAIGKWSPQASSTPAPVTADFSSRGPNMYHASLLKPDLAAPGVDVIAGVTPAMDQDGRDTVANGTATPPNAWAGYQGTSMASPHVAGVAALLRQAHPGWSPAAIKSALMTSASDTFADGLNGMNAGRLPWGQGAGHLTPNKAFDPGLVYDAGTEDYIRYMCGVPGTLVPELCAQTGSIQPHNLNMASITASAVLGKQVLTRTVTNVGAQEATYTAKASLPGFNVVVSPSQLTLAPGAKATFSVTLSRTSAPIGEWAYGNLTWSDGTHTVRSPLTARSGLIGVPARLYSEAASGSQLFSITTAESGGLNVLRGGLKPATRSDNTVTQNMDADGGAGACSRNGSASVKVHSISVPSGALLLRAALYDTDTSGYQEGELDDLDLVVMNSAGAIVATSLNTSSNEMVSLTLPAAGTYKACVIGYDPHGGSARYTLSSWVIGNNDNAGNFKVITPPVVYAGSNATVTASWSGLGVARHVGALVYKVGSTNAAVTVLEADTTDPIPVASARRGKTKGLD